MPIPETHTPHRMVRIDDDPWRRFGELVGVRQRSRVIKEFVLWYIGEKDAKLPKRPSRTAAE